MKRIDNPNGLPTFEITKDELKEGVRLVDVMVELGFARSKSEARRLIVQGAVRLSKGPQIIPSLSK